MGIVETVVPYLDIFRGFVTKGTNMLALAFDLEVSNLYVIALVLISIWSAKYILEFFYTSVVGKRFHWAGLTIIIFWILRYLGA